MRKQHYDGMKHLAAIIRNDRKQKEDLDYIYSFLMQIPFFE